MSCKIVIVDDYLMPRQLIEQLLSKDHTYDVVASCGTAEEAVAYCKDHCSDLVIMDIVMAKGINGLEAAAQIKANNPKIKIIIMTSMPEVSFLKKARAIGVESFWYKEVQELPILELVNRTMQGESIYPDDTPVVVLGQATSKDLTKKELEILRELTGGATNLEIADKLGIKTETVKMHITNMLQKTGFKNRLELAIKARIDGLVIKD